MLSTKYRLRLEFICNRIATGQEVKLEDRIWATKLGEANRSASTMLRQAERMSKNPEMPKGGLDDFLNRLDLGEPNPNQTIKKFKSPEDIVDFFHQDKSHDWRQRD